MTDKPGLAVIKLDKEKYIQAANAVLEHCKTQGYETVVVLGLKNDEFYVHQSNTPSRLFTVGALEAAKFCVVRGAYE